MKKETFKQVLFSAALLASVFEVQAQDNPITFTRDMTFRENYGWANSMCTPKIGDFDNDGVNDLWLNVLSPNPLANTVRVCQLYD